MIVRGRSTLAERLPTLKDKCMYRRGFSLGLAGSGDTPPAVKWLLIANGGMFVLQQIFEPLTGMLGLVPWRVTHEFAYYQFVTYLFLHGGFFHIFFNMLMLWMFGRELEARWGSRFFLKFYFLTGIGAGIVSFLFSIGSQIPTIGASGAVMALLVAFAMNDPDRQVYVWFLFPIKIKYLVLVFVGIDLLAAMSHTPDGVARFAHLGGALIGFLYLKADWRIFHLGRMLRDYRYERRVKKLQKRRAATRHVMDEVDRVLDRINEVGYEGLTREERRILEEASELLSRKHDS
jgi:membrane associated rhomboid family serine protease